MISALTGQRARCSPAADADPSAGVRAAASGLYDQNDPVLAAALDVLQALARGEDPVAAVVLVGEQLPCDPALASQAGTCGLRIGALALKALVASAPAGTLEWKTKVVAGAGPLFEKMLDRDPSLRAWLKDQKLSAEALLTAVAPVMRELLAEPLI